MTVYFRIKKGDTPEKDLTPCSTPPASRSQESVARDNTITMTTRDNTSPVSVTRDNTITTRDNTVTTRDNTISHEYDKYEPESCSVSESAAEVVAAD